MATQVRCARSVTVNEHCHITRHTSVTVTEGKTTDLYAIAEMDCGLSGRCFTVGKRASTKSLAARDSHTVPVSSYDVRIAGDETSCECMGWLRWGKCRHVEFLCALINARKI